MKLHLAVAFVASVLSLGAPLLADAPPRAEHVAVPGDRAASVVRGPLGAKDVLVYLPGKCGDPDAPIKAFSREAAGRATLVVVQGDVACPDRPGRTRWSASPARAHERIEAALRAASRGGESLPTARRTIIGYSEGALRAESVAKRFPDVYPRVALLASPRAAAGTSFQRSQRVAVGVGTRDAQKTTRDTVDNLHRAGVPTRLFLFPGAKHGQYGDAGGRVMSQVFDWLEGTGG